LPAASALISSGIQLDNRLNNIITHPQDILHIAGKNKRPARLSFPGAGLPDSRTEAAGNNAIDRDNKTG
jgi:hypothetical protein